LVIAGFLLWLKSGPTILRNLGLATLVFVISIALGGFGFMQLQRLQWPIKSWQVVACDVGQGDALVVKSEGKTALIDAGKYDEKIDNCLSELGIQQIDMLVLTHFDLDHVGGIKGALKNRTVGVAIVSPFKDERWGATGTSMVLAEAGIKIQTADLGANGKLGELTWQVLSPMPEAAGAEDSNDASLVILFKAKQFNLLTMADIGEQGQMRMTSNSSWWKDPGLHEVPLILKVSHHGSADQYPELIEALKPDLSLISVGANNSYGHPTQRTLKLLVDSGAAIARTDLLGSIAVGLNQSGLVISNSTHG
jgi:competence protein ComEC